jgi:NADPH:quinone reductase-like Zn-dependent oxidoreductase
MISLFSQGKKVRTFLMKAEGSDLNFLNKIISENKLKIYIDKVFPLEKVSDAHKYSQTGKSEGKVVVKIIE